MRELPINLSKKFLFVSVEGYKMKEKDVIKTVFDFFIIDLIIFSFIAGIFTLVIIMVIGIANQELSTRLTPLIAFLILFFLMYSNYKIRYKNKLGRDDAIEVLKLRYANGKITKEEFEQMKKDLS